MTNDEYWTGEFVDTRRWHDLEDWLCECDDCMDAEAVDEGIRLDPYDLPRLRY